MWEIVSSRSVCHSMIYWGPSTLSIRSRGCIKCCLGCTLAKPSLEVKTPPFTTAFTPTLSWRLARQMALPLSVSFYK